MKILPLIPGLLLSSMAVSSEPQPEESGFLSLIGGAYTEVSDDSWQGFALPYFELYCAGLIKVTPFQAGLTQDLSDGGEFRAELMVNWERTIEDWLDDDNNDGGIDTIATLSGETLLGFTMLEYSHSLWLNDLDDQQASHLGLFAPLPLNGEALMLMPSIGMDLWTAKRVESELNLDSGADAVIPYAGLTLVSSLGDDVNLILNARQQFLPDAVTELDEVTTDRRNELIVALEYHF